MFLRQGPDQSSSGKQLLSLLTASGARNTSKGVLPISPWKFSFFSGHDSYSLAWLLELAVSTGSGGRVFSEWLRLWTVSPSPTCCSAAPGGELPVTSYSGQEGLQPARVALAVGVHEDQHVPGGPGGPQHPGPGGTQPPVAPEQLHPLQPGHILAESQLELSWNRQGSGVTDATAREMAMTITRIIVNRSILGAGVSTRVPSSTDIVVVAKV